MTSSEFVAQSPAHLSRMLQWEVLVNSTELLCLLEVFGGRGLGEFGGNCGEKAIKVIKTHYVSRISDEKTLIFNTAHCFVMRKR